MNLLSVCCNSKTVVRGNVTMYYVCLSCGQPCDVYGMERKVWAKNPSTKIIPDKRKRIKRKIIDKEIEEMGGAQC